jgi:hypothetical protein
MKQLYEQSSYGQISTKLYSFCLQNIQVDCTSFSLKSQVVTGAFYSVQILLTSVQCNTQFFSSRHSTTAITATVEKGSERNKLPFAAGMPSPK